MAAVHAVMTPAGPAPMTATSKLSNSPHYFGCGISGGSAPFVVTAKEYARVIGEALNVSEDMNLRSTNRNHSERSPRIHDYLVAIGLLV